MPSGIMRLAQYLAHAGIASRRSAEDLIRSGSVSVNGAVVRVLATRVAIERDTVRVKGSVVRPEQPVYYLLHKPVGYTCSRKDRFNKKLVTELVPPKPRVYPVGRLDKDTSGLVLLTNDGALANTMMHPRHEIQKIYRVTLDKPWTQNLLDRLGAGIRLEEGIARADAVRAVNKKILLITIHQGWNRQVRRMIQMCGFSVAELARIAEGNLRLGALPVGSYRTLERPSIHV